MNIPVMEPCQVLMYPQDKIYEESIRQFQGCPTIAITKKGRIFAGWYSGGIREPHMDNYNLIMISDDLGKTWKGPAVVIPSDKEKLIHSLDIQLWTDPKGRLWVFWVQERTKKAEGNEREGFVVDGYVFTLDRIHGEWAMICEDPDADEPVFTEPRRLDDGFLRCKPLTLSDGRWINFNYDQNCDRYGYSISGDEGRTWTRHYGCKKIETPFDEAMAVEKRDGSIHMMARTAYEVHALAETYSHDGGMSWEEARLSPFQDPSSRFYYSRTPSGNLLLIKNDHANNRSHMTAFLSTDDGATWPYRLLIDERDGTSYPDADFFAGKIYLLHDLGRCEEKEIVLSVFTEEDIMEGRRPEGHTISKP